MITNFPYQKSENYEKLNIAEKILFHILKATFVLLFYFSTTYLYTFYLLISTVGNYSHKSDICTTIFLCFVLFTFFLSVALSILLKSAVFKKYVNFLIGEQFFNKYHVKTLNGFLPPLMLFSAMVFPIALEYYSLSEKLELYRRLTDPLVKAYIFESESARIYTPLMSEIYERLTTYTKPCKGIVTDILEKIGL